MIKDPEILAFRELAKENLYFFCKHVLQYPDVNKLTHKDITDALQSPTKRKLIVVPRGCLKSTIACVAYPIWLLVNNPNERILIDSELYTNSKNFLREIRAHFESEMMTYLFGDFTSSTWNESELIIKQRTRRYKEASITVGGISTTKVGQHFSKIISDDLNSNQNSQNAEQRKKVIDHYKYNISILEPDGTYVLVGTRYHEDDVIGHILRAELQIKDEDAFDFDGKTVSVS